MSTAPRIGQVLPSTTPIVDPIPPTYVPELSADRISAGRITGAVIEVGENGVIRAGQGDTSIELVQGGLFGYVDNALVFRLADGELFVKGTIEADDGYFAGDLVGAHIYGSMIEGAEITGGTITIGVNDAVFRASPLGISLGSTEWSTAPFRVDATGRLTASAATIVGTITGSEIIGSTITGTDIVGSTVATAEIGPRIIVDQFISATESWGNIRFFADVAGETPAQIMARTIGSTKTFSLVTGVDGGTGELGPELHMTVESDGAGGWRRVVDIDADLVRIGGRVL